MVKPIIFGEKQICKAGGYSRTVSLPKVWLENMGLDAGDGVEMTMNSEGFLVIRPVKKK